MEKFITIKGAREHNLKNISAKIKFIGIGGGRKSMLTQKIKTGGIYLEFIKDNIHTRIFLDPGVGAFIRALEQKIKFKKINGLLVSHCHTDHINDAPVVIEAMTDSGRDKRAGLYAPKTAINYISDYHKNCVKTIKTLDLNEKFKINNILIKATKTIHSEKDNFGFIFDDFIGYTSDTIFTPKIAEQYKNTEILIINCAFFKNPYKGNDRGYGQHLDAYDAVKLLKIAKPKICLLYHLGISVLNYGFQNTKKYIQNNSGVKTIIPEIGKNYNY